MTEPRSLTYWRLGPDGGPVVLLLHPWFGCAAFWDDVLPALQGCRVLVPDLYSPARGTWHAMANPQGLSEAVTAVLDAEDADTCRVAGNSMGGILAQMIAIAEPARVSHLVLIGTGARSHGLKSAFRERLDRWLRTREPGTLEQLTRGLVAPRAAGSPAIDACVARLARVNPDYLAAIPTSTMNTDLRPGLTRVTARTLVGRGGLDSIRTRAHAEELAASIPDARAVEIPRAGHSPMVDSAARMRLLLREHFEL